MRKLLIGLIAIGVAASLPFAGSLGLFTDEEPVGSNTLTTGTISLSATPASSLLSLSAMFPGDAVINELTLANDGTGELRYAMTTSVTEEVLSSLLTLEIKGGLLTCDATSMDDALLGTVVYSGALKDATFGDPTAGEQAGDRTLAASASEKLCFRALLVSGVGNDAQGLSTTATFTFHAEQTSSNP